SLEVRGHNITTRTRATIFHTARILTVVALNLAITSSTMACSSLSTSGERRTCSNPSMLTVNRLKRGRLGSAISPSPAYCSRPHQAPTQTGRACSPVSHHPVPTRHHPTRNDHEDRD